MLSVVSTNGRRLLFRRLPPAPSPEGVPEDLHLSSSSLSDEAFESAAEFQDEQPFPPGVSGQEETALAKAGLSPIARVEVTINGHCDNGGQIRDVESRVQEMNLGAAAPSSSSAVFSPHSPSGSPPSLSATFSPRTPSLSPDPQPSTPQFSPPAPSTPSIGGGGDGFGLPDHPKMTAVNVSYVDSPYKFVVSGIGGNVYYYQSDY